jgi:hypothetical protein
MGHVTRLGEPTDIPALKFQTNRGWLVNGTLSLHSAADAEPRVGGQVLPHGVSAGLAGRRPALLPARGGHAGRSQGGAEAAVRVVALAHTIAARLGEWLAEWLAAKKTLRAGTVHSCESHVRPPACIHHVP